MPEKSVAEALGEIIVARSDFQTLFRKLELIVAAEFLGLNHESEIEQSDVSDLLRYADVLSHSPADTHRTYSYSVVSLLHDCGQNGHLSSEQLDLVYGITEAVLVRLGNFPGLHTLRKTTTSKYAFPLSTEVARAYKTVVHANSRRDAILTDAQYKITQTLRDVDYVSFSGPTSLGKSFIIKDMIYDLARSEEMEQKCIVVLVPTKALIGQTATDLRELLKDIPEVNISTYPSLPNLMRERYSRSIFVLTPERLLRYLARPVREIDYLIVDEAQKIVSENDARSSLYYHSIVEVTRRFAAKLVFSSPGISNPDIFLDLFGKSKKGALPVSERSVVQRRYFVDLLEQKQYYYPAFDSTPQLVEGTPGESDVAKFILHRSRGRKAIIYVNGAGRAAELATELAARLPEIHEKAVSANVNFVREFLHAKYFLAETLKHGVAYHHGKMPQEVRERVEAMFSDPGSDVRFVVCTSTLLEGVNLPAKNIFILSEKHGPRPFSEIDFENLAGRAGRLTHDFSGNVICVRSDEARWVGDSIRIISNSKQLVAKSFLVNPPSNTKKDYTDIAHVLRGSVVPGHPSADKVRSLRKFASILTLHMLDHQPSPLLLNFMSKVDDAAALLKSASESLEFPVEAIRSAPEILPEYQNNVWRELLEGASTPLIPAGSDLSSFETYHHVLRTLFRLYDWRKTESTGNFKLVNSKSSADAIDRRLKYWAILMQSWVRGDQLSFLIRRSIQFHMDRGIIRFQDFERSDSLITEIFDPGSARHVNIIIERVLEDIESGLRFRIISYLQNFHDLSVRALGPLEAGLNIAQLVEYGTDDPRAVELQEVGFSRSAALRIVDEYIEFLDFSENGELVAFDYTSMLELDGFDESIRDEVASVFDGR